MYENGKVNKIYPTCYNLLITQDLWQAHYQIFSIIFLKKFLKLNVNADTITKSMKFVEVHTKHPCFLELINFKDD